MINPKKDIKLGKLYVINDAAVQRLIKELHKNQLCHPHAGPSVRLRATWAGHGNKTNRSFDSFVAGWVMHNGTPSCVFIEIKSGMPLLSLDTGFSLLDGELGRSFLYGEVVVWIPKYVLSLLIKLK